ncbi:unnamed protein product [Albugo candida]|uniref:Uncharacterized protein n=1 Tax=Albugo candida TaxID=65357 RepID=A0A024FY67_9STRA|nr:unnamed protein product [Albugo candida]|eukprot:CCI11604.1 unnamed protein product [Albugo candida]
MKMPIALSAVVSLNQGLHIDAYKIHTPVGHNYRQLSRCHKCLQRFALYANLTYVLTEPNARGRKTHDDRLKMVAEIDNHIPFWSVQDSCLSTICATHTIILKDERKRFHKTNPSSSLDLHSGAHLVVDEEKRNDKVNDESNEVSISGTDLIGRGSNDRRDSVTEEFRSPDNWRKKRNDNEWKVAHKKFRLFGATFDVMSYDASNIAKNMSANPDGKNSFHQGYDSLKQASTAKNVLVSTNNRNDALKTLQIIGATVHKQNDIPTFTSYCLLLQKICPNYSFKLAFDVWILVTLM